MEIWKDIKGYEGYYQVSSLGNIKSLNFARRKEHKLLTQLKDKDGYCKVNLYKKTAMKRKSVHKIVAENFIENLENKPQVNHIDGNKENNSVSNLEWMTSKENIAHSIKTGLTKNKGKDNVNSRKVICVTTGKIYDCIIDAAREYNICHSNITTVCKGRRKYAGTDIKTGENLVWKYMEVI